MAETYKVKQYVGAEDDYAFTPRDGGNEMMLRPHQVLLEGPDAPNSTVTVNRLADGETPTVGEELVGDIIKGKNGYRFQKDQSGFTQSSNGQQEMSPDRTRSIERQTCAKAAGPTLAALTANEGWRKTFAEDSRFIVDALHAAVRGD